MQRGRLAGRAKLSHSAFPAQVKELAAGVEVSVTAGSSFSNRQWLCAAHAEILEALVLVLKGALVEFDGVPALLRSENLCEAVVFPTSYLTEGARPTVTVDGRRSQTTVYVYGSDGS